MKESRFTGELLGLIGTNMLALFIVVLTLGICFPWAVCIKQRWYTKHTFIEGR